MFEFASPWMACLLLLPLVAGYFLPPQKEKVARALLRFPHLDVLKRTIGGTKLRQTIAVRFFVLLISLFWLCLVLAMMQPQHVKQMEDVRSEGYDIMLAVDLSGSMRAMDFLKNWQPTSRLEMAKQVVGDFVKGREDDRIGLVLFGDFAYQYAPLTLDRESVVKMLDDTVIAMAGQSTAIGDAIGLSVKGLRDRPENSRIIILLTDGEDTSSSIPPLQAAKLAADYGIKIYTIGIGSDGTVPARDSNGNLQMVRTKLDAELLKEIAKTTGGSFFRANDATTLIRVYEKINELEKTEAESLKYLIKTPLYRYPLGMALVLFTFIAIWPLVVQGLRGLRGAIRNV